jgi:hypothetical protein
MVLSAKLCVGSRGDLTKLCVASRWVVRPRWIQHLIHYQNLIHQKLCSDVACVAVQLLDPGGRRSSPQFNLFRELVIRAYLAVRASFLILVVCHVVEDQQRQQLSDVEHPVLASSVPLQVCPHVQHPASSCL